MSTLSVSGSTEASAAGSHHGVPGVVVVSIGSGVVLVAVAAALVGAGAALATTVYSVTILGLFGVSALYHRHTWRTPRARAIMKRLDHSMIFLFIAGTYTPVAALAMAPGTARWVLTVVWGGALLGVLLKTVWPHAPSWFAVRRVRRLLTMRPFIRR